MGGVPYRLVQMRTPALIGSPACVRRSRRCAVAHQQEHRRRVIGLIYNCSATLPSMRVLYVVGARPNFVKMAALIGALKERLSDGHYVLVRTGPALRSDALTELS